LRLGRGNIQEAFAGPQNDELYLFNAYIPEYENGGYARHEPRRPRKLLLHRREINRLLGAVQQGGMTLVPLGIYFNNRGVAKVDLGLCRGKKNVDKRETIKQRDWNREKHRLLKNG
jgi:SsrA-binding protein